MNDFTVQSVELEDPTKPNEGNATILFSGKYDGYKMKVSMKNGKKEGKGAIFRENNTLFMELNFVNDVAEGELTERDRMGHIILKGCLHEGRKNGLFIEFNDKNEEMSRCFYRSGVLTSDLKKSEQINGYFDEVNESGVILSISQYTADRSHKDGICYEYENGECKRKYRYKNDEKGLLMSEFKGEVMIDYDDNGKRVYEGGYVLDKDLGYVRNGEGSEFTSDGVSALYVGHYEKGVRSGEGTLYADGYPQYIGEWKNGLKNGMGKEYDKNGKVVKEGVWTNGNNGLSCKERCKIVTFALCGFVILVEMEIVVFIIANS